MKTLRFSTFVGAIALIAGSVGSAQAEVFTEDFEGTFPAWESNWFGTQSTGRNYFCNGCGRGSNPDGLWIAGTAVGPSPIEVSFDAGFGASLTSFKLDIAGYLPTTLEAFDAANARIFSQNVFLTFGASTDPGTYSTYTITSANGISRFTFSGDVSGSTSIDNLVATTAPIPEPETYALMLAGLGLLSFVVRRREQKSVA